MSALPSRRRYPAARVAVRRAGHSSLPRFFAPPPVPFDRRAELELRRDGTAYRLELLPSGARVMLHLVTEGRDRVAYLEPALPEGFASVSLTMLDIATLAASLGRMAYRADAVFEGSVLEAAIDVAGFIELLDAPILAGEDRRILPWSARRALLEEVCDAGRDGLPRMTQTFELTDGTMPVETTPGRVGLSGRLVRTGEPYRFRRRLPR